MQSFLIFYAPFIVVGVSIAAAFYVGLKDGPVKKYEQ
ncbi:cytochrome bd oxidase small subunit CydS [Brevibacillus sp. NRS-1366]